MNPVHTQLDDSGDDSDIQEIAIISPPHNCIGNDSIDVEKRLSPIGKKRKSSPQMDPIPGYSPTPLHILEQRSRFDACQYPTSRLSPIHVEYEPRAIYHAEEADDNHDSPPSRSDEYTPLLRPSRHVISCEYLDTFPDRNHSSRQDNRSTSSDRPRVARKEINPGPTSTNRNPNAPRPVSSALAKAVNRKRSLTVDKDKTRANNVSASTEYAQQPVMWSPKLPSEIIPIKDQSEPDIDRCEDHSEHRTINAPKPRVAHKPTIPRDSRNRPRVPAGVSKKVPQAFRMKYLDVIINEYLNTGHKEDESYREALKEEQVLANRAANRNIYVNLVAGLKKKIREKAGISTLPQDDDPKFINGNKVVSHEDIITGKVVGTFSIQRKRRLSDPAELNEFELYDRLSRYVLPPDELLAYGYPCRDPENPDLRLAPMAKDGSRQKLRVQLATTYTCDRCAKVYRVNEEGIPIETTGKCIFHPGHLWNERINRALEKRYSCCKGDQSAGGCSSNPYHVHKGELELENYQNYVETSPKFEREPNRHGIYALDCEMCHTTHGLELTRVTVIDHKYEVVYETLVKPKNPVLDYNTKFSGIKAGDLDAITTTISDVQRDLLKMFSDKTTLIGHSLDSDMRALKIFHKRFIDTAHLFPHKRGLPYKRALRTLMVENLRMIIQEDAGHDSKEDASAALKLVMWKAKTDVPVKAKI